jgi:hypothetical protein
MWYYSFNNQPVGPVDENELKVLFARGVINFDTLIWREGMPDWKRYGEITMAVPSVSPVNQTSAVNIAMPEPGRPKRTGLKSLFTWWLVTLILSVVAMALIIWVDYQAINGMNTGMMAGLSALMCVSYIPFIAYVVLQFILIYKLWKVVQDGYASTSAGKAVGFLFIPLFNYYWMFRAFWGLSKDLNAYIDRHFANRPELNLRRASGWISLTYLIFTLGGGLVGNIIYMQTISQRLYTMTGIDPSFSTANLLAVLAPMMIFAGIFSVICLALMIAMFVDFYKTADSILEAEEHQ